MVTKSNLRICNLAICIVCIILSNTNFDCADLGGSTSKPRTRNYFELRRQKTSTTPRTTTTAPTSVFEDAPVLEDQHTPVLEDDEDEAPPRVTGNSRGGSEFAQEPAILKTAVDKSEPNVKDASTAKSVRGRSYLEYFRPGATPRQLSTSTKRPRKLRLEMIDNTNAPPSGCSQCRLYCKQCRGSEEVKAGGVWGCCNHNCCGGRCSCQKVSAE